MHKMNLVAVVLSFALVVMASSDLKKEYYDVANPGPLFESFVKDYNRVYKDDADKELHYHAFVKNLGKINDMNKKNPSAVFGINKFADYTDEERQSMHGFRKPEPKKE